MKNALTLSLFALLASCAADFDNTDTDTDTDCGDKCDGIGDFGKIELSHDDRAPVYICLAPRSDARCEFNLPADEDALAAAMETGMASASATKGLYKYGKIVEGLWVSAREIRVLSARPTAAHGLVISDVSVVGDELTSLGAVQVEYREEDDEEWIDVALQVDDWHNRRYDEDIYWREVKVQPAMEVADGQGVLCSSDQDYINCETRDSGVTSIPGVLGPSRTEYRITALPVWDLGTFNDGEYTISFKLKGQ